MIPNSAANAGFVSGAQARNVIRQITEMVKASPRSLFDPSCDPGNITTDVIIYNLYSNSVPNREVRQYKLQIWGSMHEPTPNWDFINAIGEIIHESERLITTNLPPNTYRLFNIPAKYPGQRPTQSSVWQVLVYYKPRT